MDPLPVDQIAEFCRLADAYRATILVANTTGFDRVGCRMAELRDVIENRLFELADQIAATPPWEQ